MPDAAEDFRRKRLATVELETGCATRALCPVPGEVEERRLREQRQHHAFTHFAAHGNGGSVLALFLKEVPQ